MTAEVEFGGNTFKMLYSFVLDSVLALDRPCPLTWLKRAWEVPEHIQISMKQQKCSGNTT